MGGGTGDSEEMVISWLADVAVFVIVNKGFKNEKDVVLTSDQYDMFGCSTMTIGI